MSIESIFLAVLILLFIGSATNVLIEGVCCFLDWYHHPDRGR